MASFGWGAKKARGELSDKVKGLTGGAEDYMVKPFEMLELLVRIDKILKRFQQEEISLKPMEFDCLMMLVHNRNKALTRKQLLTVLWLLFRGPVNSNL